MPTPLEIKIGLDRTEAIESARRLRAELKGVNQGVVADAKIVSEEETAVHRKARDERKKFAKEGAEASKMTFASVAMAAQGTIATITAMTSAMRAYSDILDQVRRKESERAKAALGGLESMRELAALQGAKPDAGFVRAQARERRFTLQTVGEQVGFGKALADGGAQFIGSNVTAAQDKEVRSKVAALAVARGINPDAAGTLLGKIYGARDWRGRDPAEIVTEFGATAAQLSAGSGDASHLAKETTKVMAALSSDDVMRGRIRGPAAAARMVSMIAESSPGEEAAATRALAKGLFDFQDKKSRGILTEAKISQTDDMETALRKIAPVIEARAKAKGVPTQAIVSENFVDEQVRTALTGSLNSLGKGVLEQRRGVEAQARMPGAMESALADFRANVLGANRVQATNEETDETLRGIRGAPLELLEQRARTRLKPSLESSFNQGLNLLIKAGSLGAFDAEKDLVSRNMMADLMSRAPEDVRREFEGQEPPTHPEMRRKFFGKVMGRMEAAGVDPLTGGSADPVLEELRKQSAMMAGKGQAPPAPLVGAPPVPRR